MLLTFHSRSERSAAADTSSGGSGSPAVPAVLEGAAVAAAAPAVAAPAKATATTLQQRRTACSCGLGFQRHGVQPTQRHLDIKHELPLPAHAYLLVWPASWVRTVMARVLSTTIEFWAA